MDIEFEKFLNEDLKAIKMTDEKIVKQLNDVKEVMTKDITFFEQAMKIDTQKWKKKIDLNQLSKIIDRYICIKQELLKNENRENEKIEKMVISYYGNPFVTFHLCLQALIYQKQILLETGEFMLSTNIYIVKIMNQILEENHLPKLILHYIQILDTKDIIERKIKTIIIGATQNKAKYLGKYTYVPYNNYILYCVDDNFKKLRKNIYEYALNNFFEIEVLYEEDIEEAINIINLEKHCIAVILTKDLDLQNLFKEKIKNKMYVNENPFFTEEMNFPLNAILLT